MKFLARLAAMVGAVLILLAILNWEGVMLGIAVSSSEGRPPLLADAEWDDPNTAHEFNARFPLGAPEPELLAWLNDNEFEIDAELGRAERRVSIGICNEDVRVVWSTDQAGRLEFSEATVSEAGCL
jgi:hypothetical protein